MSVMLLSNDASPLSYDYPTDLIMASDVSLLTYDYPVEVVLQNETLRYDPYPMPGGITALYLQKCVDTVTVDWVYWMTSYQDVLGAEYPGAGFDFSTYKIETIIYDQE